MIQKKWQIFSLVAVSIFMSTLDSSIVNVALPYIMTDLGENMGSIRWVVVIYLLTVSSLLLAFGRLSDIKGRPLVYKAGFAVFTLGSLCCALSSQAWTLVVSRAIQGMGAAMLMACSPALIVDAFEPEHRGRALGLMGACVAAGLTTGPLAGGVLLAFFSWRSIFIINLPVGAAALWYAGKVLKDRGSLVREPIDFPGGILAALAMGGFILALAKAPEWGLSSWKGFGSLALALVSALGWYRHSRSTRFPLLDPALLRVRAFILPLSAAMALFAALFSLIFLMPFYLSLACGFSPAKTGMVMIAPFICLLGISPVAGALSDRLGSRMFCILGLGCLAFSLFWLGRLTPDQGIPRLLGLLALAGTGTALFVPPNSTSVMGAVSLNLRGVASGALATARNLGMVMGVSLSSTIFSATFARLTQGVRLDAFTPGLTPQFLTAFRYAMTAGSCLALLGLGLTLCRKPHKGH